MGADYVGFTVIGLRIPMEELFDKSIEYKNRCICKQRYTPKYKKEKFCPICGQNLRLEHEVFSIKTDFKKIFQSIEFPSSEYKVYKFQGYSAYESSENDNAFYIGMFISRTDMIHAYSSHAKREEINVLTQDEIEKFIDKMKEIKLYSGDRFGIWTVIDVS